MSKTFWAKDAYALSRHGAKCTMHLPPRCRFIVVVAGQTPTVLPITETGSWEIDIPPDLLPTITEWPVLVLILPKKHATLYATMKPEMATDVIRQARASYASAAN